MNTYQLIHIRSGISYEVDAVDFCDLQKRAKGLFLSNQEDDFTIETIVKIPEPYYPTRRKKRYAKKSLVRNR